MLAVLMEIDGVDVNCCNDEIGTPLCVGVSHHSMECVSLLLGDSRVNVWRPHKTQQPLHTAVECGFIDLIELLLAQNGVDLNLTNENVFF